MPTEEDPDELIDCRRCYAAVKQYNLELHMRWHIDLEGLQEPTSEFGIWDADKRWTANSSDW